MDNTHFRADRGGPYDRPNSACPAFAAMDVAPQRGPTANRDPTAPSQPRPFSPSPPPSPRLPPSPYGLWRTRRRTGLPSPIKRNVPPGGEGGSPSPLPSPIEGEGVASKPYGADGRIAEEYGRCKGIMGKRGTWVHPHLRLRPRTPRLRRTGLPSALPAAGKHQGRGRAAGGRSGSASARRRRVISARSSSTLAATFGSPKRLWASSGSVARS